jgi:DNA-binding NtrC family response regulator
METILVVDDEILVVDATVSILQRAGCEVFSALNANDALAFCRSRRDPIQLLISDIIMPGFNGTQLAACLKDLCPDVRTIYMSGYSVDRIAERGIALSPQSEFIQKPFTPSALRTKVREILDRPRVPEFELPNGS